MSADYSSLNVLVVDDQAHVRQFIRGVLASLGVDKVTDAANGRAALQAVAEPGTSFDLILCDLRMPDKDGIETIRTLASMGLHCAVAILSIENERVIESAAFLATLGGLRLVGALSKPLTIEKLEPVLNRVLAGAAAEAKPIALDINEKEVADAFAHNELQIHYQPKIHIRSGDCVGAEAVVRWKHPRHGLLSDDVLLPMIEHSPIFLTQLTTLILREAIAAAGRWQADGRGFGVAVTLSPAVFNQLDLPETIEAIAIEHGVVAANITIEIAESTLPADISVMVDVAARLRIKGFHLALDHFTGAHSGIQEILKLPFNELKLAASSVDGCADSDSKRAVVEAGLAVARNLKLTTVAVGVGRRLDWNLLSELGCEVAQGRFIANAMPEDGFAIWSTQWMMTKR